MVCNGRIYTLLEFFHIGKPQLLFIFQPIDSFVSFFQYRYYQDCTTVFLSIINSINTGRKIKEDRRITPQIIFEVTILIKNGNSVIGSTFNCQEYRTRNKKHNHKWQKKSRNQKSFIPNTG